MVWRARKPLYTLCTQVVGSTRSRRPRRWSSGVDLNNSVQRWPDVYYYSLHDDGLKACSSVVGRYGVSMQCVTNTGSGPGGKMSVWQRRG